MLISVVEVISNFDEHLDSSIEKTNIIRNIDRFAREMTSRYDTTLYELSSRIYDTRLFRFHVHLADYAGALCGLLKDLKQFSSSLILARLWAEIVKAIDNCQDRVSFWNVSGCKGPEPSCPEMDLLEVRVQQLINADYVILDRDLQASRWIKRSSTSKQVDWKGYSSSPEPSGFRTSNPILPCCDAFRSKTFPHLSPAHAQITTLRMPRIRLRLL